MPAGQEHGAHDSGFCSGSGEWQGSWERHLAASRLILLLITAVLALMPLTEHLWTWDSPITSGHDLEFTLLGLFLFFGLVALVAHQALVSSPVLLRLIPLPGSPPAGHVSPRSTPAFARRSLRRTPVPPLARSLPPQAALPLRI